MASLISLDKQLLFYLKLIEEKYFRLFFFLPVWFLKLFFFVIFKSHDCPGSFAFEINIKLVILSTETISRMRYANYSIFRSEIFFKKFLLVLGILIFEKNYSPFLIIIVVVELMNKLMKKKKAGNFRLVCVVGFRDQRMFVLLTPKSTHFFLLFSVDSYFFFELFLFKKLTLWCCC